MNKEIVDCQIQLSNTAEFLYAHADLKGVEKFSYRIPLNFYTPMRI